MNSAAGDTVSDTREDGRPWPSEAYSWYVVFVLCVCGMVAFIDRQIINLLVEDIRAFFRPLRYGAAND
jgi:hypothetical protein